MENKMKFLKLKKEEAERVSGGQDSEWRFNLKEQKTAGHCERCNRYIFGTQAEIDYHISNCIDEWHRFPL